MAGTRAAHARLSTRDGTSAAAEPATIPSLREALTLDRPSLPVLHVLIQLSICPSARVARPRLSAGDPLLGNRLLRGALLLIRLRI